MHKSELQQSLKLLLAWKHLTVNALAVKIAESNDPKMTQAKVRRIASESKEPRDSSIKPVADYFGLTVAQIKDADYVQSFINGGALEGRPDAVDPRLKALINDINLVPDDRRDEVLDAFAVLMNLYKK